MNPRLLALALLVSSAAWAGNLVEASLVSEHPGVLPGAPLTVAVRLKVPPRWHVYWKNPGDSGLPPKLTWQLPPGLTAGPILWPTPHRMMQGPLANYGFDGDVWLLTEVVAARALETGKPLRVSVDAEWLVCQDECIPEKAALDLTLPTVERPGPPGPNAAGFVSARERLPRKLGWRAELGHERAKEHTVELRVTTGALPLPGAHAEFFPQDGGLIEATAEQTFEPRPDGFVLTLTCDRHLAGFPARLAGVLVLHGQQDADEVSVELTTPAPEVAPAREPLPLGLALLFAFVGGLLLNLMPCVLPVLGVKVMSFVKHAQADGHRARAHGLVFGGGVLASFWILAAALFALRASGNELGWGFQLQSPLVVSVLAMLFFALGLSFLGFVEVGATVQSAAGAVRFSDTLWGSFGSGVLATAVATPCTAPFMGAALGYALLATPLVGLSIFTALGVGMAMPYVLLSFSPELLRKVPKPGAWMQTLQQALAFPLFGTSVWLLSVLSVQGGAEKVLLALIGVLLVGFALWLWRLFGAPEASRSSRILGGVTATCALGLALWFNAGGSQAHARPPGPAAPPEPHAALAPDAQPQVAWVDWSEDRLARLQQEGRIVFVDYTAAWCITCQVNERVVFSSREVRERFAQLGVVPMRADWTRSDPAITRALAGFGRSGVPLNVLHGRGAPVILPSVLTPGVVLQALDELVRPAGEQR
ncbi:MAG: thioredoxin family protein [Deltaproteobacteria bacterium]|nr:thioredoxin family protein [Deltaproteobacteria bacterium]